TLFTQPGSWLCQTRLWPRIVSLLAVAKFTIWSAAPKLNWPWLGSVVSHFISFSGVTELNSRLTPAEYFVSLARALAWTAVPIALPLAVARVRRASAAATGWARRATPMPTSSIAAVAAARSQRPAPGPWLVRVSDISLLLRDRS